MWRLRLPFIKCLGMSRLNPVCSLTAHISCPDSKPRNVRASGCQTVYFFFKRHCPCQIVKTFFYRKTVIPQRCVLFKFYIFLHFLPCCCKNLCSIQQSPSCKFLIFFNVSFLFLEKYLQMERCFAIKNRSLTGFVNLLFHSAL